PRYPGLLAEWLIGEQEMVRGAFPGAGKHDRLAYRASGGGGLASYARSVMNGRVGWGFGIFIAILVALHFLLRVGLGYGQLAPDLLVVALLLAARQVSAGSAAGLGLLFGILDGAIVPPAMGASALALTVVGFVGAR